MVYYTYNTQESPEGSFSADKALSSDNIRKAAHSPTDVREPLLAGSRFRETDMRNLTRLTVGLVLISSPAWAGEITGSGNLTPIKTGGVASSICAFSGLNPEGDGPNALVQSYGQIRAAFGGPAPFAGLPGVECRGV
jgi:hypothetical protein